MSRFLQLLSSKYLQNFVKIKMLKIKVSFQMKHKKMVSDIYLNHEPDFLSTQYFTNLNQSGLYRKQVYY